MREGKHNSDYANDANYREHLDKQLIDGVKRGE